MARGRRGPREVAGADPALRDPYAAAADRVRERQAARGELDTDVPRRRRPVLPKVLVFGGVLGVIGLVGSQLDTPDPIPPNCERTDFVLGRTEITGAGAIRYRLTGAETERYVVAVDAATVRRTAGGFESEPLPGSVGGFRAVSREITPEGCRASGQLSVDDRPGTRTLTVFRVSGGAPAPVASATVTVHPPR